MQEAVSAMFEKLASIAAPRLPQETCMNVVCRREHHEGLMSVRVPSRHLSRSLVATSWR